MPTQEPDSSRGGKAQEPETSSREAQFPHDDDGLYDPFTFERVGTRSSGPTGAVTPSPDPVEIEAWLAEAFPEATARMRLSGLRSKRIARRTYPLQMGREHGTSPPLSVRLPRWLEEQIREEFIAIGVSPSEGLRQVLEEWWVSRHYPALEYRSPEFLRLAAIRGGAPVREWFATMPRPPLSDEVRQQVLDYIELFRSRLEAERGPST